jgi:hypothetical protein
MRMSSVRVRAIATVLAMSPVRYVTAAWGCRYGTKIHKDYYARLGAAVLRYKSSNLYCQMFGRLVGLFDNEDDQLSEFYMWLFGLIMDGRKRHGADVALALKDGSVAVSVGIRRSHCGHCIHRSHCGRCIHRSHCGRCIHRSHCCRCIHPSLSL